MERASIKRGRPPFGETGIQAGSMAERAERVAGKEYAVPIERAQDATQTVEMQPRDPQLEPMPRVSSVYALLEDQSRAPPSPPATPRVPPPMGSAGSLSKVPLCQSQQKPPLTANCETPRMQAPLVPTVARQNIPRQGSHDRCGSPWGPGGGPQGPQWHHIAQGPFNSSSAGGVLLYPGAGFAGTASAAMAPGFPMGHLGPPAAPGPSCGTHIWVGPPLVGVWVLSNSPSGSYGRLRSSAGGAWRAWPYGPNGTCYDS